MVRGGCGLGWIYLDLSQFMASMDLCMPTLHGVSVEAPATPRYRAPAGGDGPSLKKGIPFDVQ